MVYARIVRNKVRDTFAAVNRGDYMTMIDGLADDFVYVFHGDHALGGRRITREDMTAWWQRALRLLPGARFEPQEILVDGWPWRTRITVKTRVTGALPGGAHYENTLVQLMTLRWGKITEIESIEDLQVLCRALDLLAAEGVAEAHAAPINSSVR